MVDDVIRRLGYLALGTRLKRLGERLQSNTQRIIDELGLPIQAAQYPFLAAIDLLGPVTIGDLADAVGVSQPAATRTLALLADSGYVAITTASDDQRRKLVALAPKGHQLVDTGKRTAWPTIESVVRELCEGCAGPLLAQLAAIEDGLATASLAQRAAAVPSRAKPARGGRTAGGAARARGERAP